VVRALFGLLIAIVAGVLGAGGLPPIAVARTEDCRTRGRTVEANGYVRVFVSVRAEGQVRIYYGCDLARRRARELGVRERGAGGVTAHFGLAGRRIAFESIHCGDPTDPCSGHVWRTDMRTGRVRIVAQMTGPREAPPASDLLLTPDDTVVWIRPDGAPGPNGLPGPAVSKVGPDGRLVVLDPGPGVEPGSLATAGNRIYWTRSGAAQTFLAGR
jgi:hypothetical protein